MKRVNKTIEAIMVLILFSQVVKTQAQIPGLPTVNAKTPKIWEAIAPYFSPPQRFKGIYGKYRSPLIFYNGDRVQTKQDWQKRSKEIRSRWMHMMGEWPSFLKKQKMTRLDSTRRDGFTQYRICFKWLPNEKTEGYLLIPDSSRGKKMPAVIVVYYQPKTAIGDRFPGFDYKYRDFALQLAKRGFITLSLGTTKTTKAKTYSLYYPSIDSAQIEPLSTLAYAAANVWYVLSKVPEVDSTRIGIMGHSYGGKWAMFASCLFDKFAAAVWSDPGIIFDDTKPNANYWAPWYLGYTPPPWGKRSKISTHYPEKGLYPKLRAEGYNLQELQALMAPRPFLVSGGVVDTPNRWIVLNHSIAVNRLLGYKNRVAMTNRRLHSPNPRSNQIAYLFFEYFLNRN
jgi:dienelactone hydrolase